MNLMDGSIEMSYLVQLRNRFRTIPVGDRIEIELDRLGASNGSWTIPNEFKELFKDCSIRIESAEIINRLEVNRRFTFMMYNMGGELGITFIS
ncbi:hypothetical protein LV84_02279 [Algoriphagus ratkowskyi]|uniref:Uncharacterized protein n=2 Tax=Algoriphagus ratkowskyi TaxID=57028 RepID=A0A2W7RK12_9BACT|nr:hypothetical protein LV84_02279 [Algoriphagus ratkowskyi]